MGYAYDESNYVMVLRARTADQLYKSKAEASTNRRVDDHIHSFGEINVTFYLDSEAD